MKFEDGYVGMKVTIWESVMYPKKEGIISEIDAALCFFVIEGHWYDPDECSPIPTSVQFIREIKE